MQFNPLLFNELSLKDKIDLIQQFGEYVTHTTEDNRFIDLYLISGRYVEVKHRESLFNIEAIDIISNKDERLEIFLSKISLKQLL